VQLIEEQFNQRWRKLQQDSEQAQAEQETTVAQLRTKLAQKEEQVQQITARKKHMQIDLDHGLA